MGSRSSSERHGHSDTSGRRRHSSSLSADHVDDDVQPRQLLPQGNYYSNDYRRRLRIRKEQARRTKEGPAAPTTVVSTTSTSNNKHMKIKDAASEGNAHRRNSQLGGAEGGADAAAPPCQPVMAYSDSCCSERLHSSVTSIRTVPHRVERVAPLLPPQQQQQEVPSAARRAAPRRGPRIAPVNENVIIHNNNRNTNRNAGGGSNRRQAQYRRVSPPAAEHRQHRDQTMLFFLLATQHDASSGGMDYGVGDGGGDAGGFFF